MNHRPTRRSDQRDAARQKRERPLALGLERALRLEAAFELLDRRPQLAGPVVIEPAHHQVHPPVLGVIVDLAGDHQLLPVFRQEWQTAGRAAEDHRPHGGRGIFEREPHVTAAQRRAADLSLDDHALEARRQQVVNAGIELEHGERLDRVLGLDRHQGTTFARSESRR